MTQIDRKMIQATDEQIEAALEAALPQYPKPLVTIEDVTFGSLNEMDHFRQALASWRRPGTVIRDDADALVIEMASATKGQAQRDIALVRFGDYVAIYGVDS